MLEIVEGALAGEVRNGRLAGAEAFGHLGKPGFQDGIRNRAGSGLLESQIGEGRGNAEMGDDIVDGQLPKCVRAYEGERSVDDVGGHDGGRQDGRSLFHFHALGLGDLWYNMSAFWRWVSRC